MAAKAQLTSSGVVVATAATVNSNPGIPTILIGAAATSRVPSANLEASATKKEALEKIAKGLNASTIAVRRPADGGGVSKVTPEDVQVVLAAILS